MWQIDFSATIDYEKGKFSGTLDLDDTLEIDTQELIKALGYIYSEDTLNDVISTIENDYSDYSKKFDLESTLEDIVAEKLAEVNDVNEFDISVDIIDMTFVRSKAEWLEVIMKLKTKLNDTINVYNNVHKEGLKLYEIDSGSKTSNR